MVYQQPARRISALQEDEGCFYCGALIPHYVERDHFPLPKNVGGRLRVKCCITCHDMKDRYRLNQWPVEWVAKVIEDFPKFNRETKLFLAKAMSTMGQVCELEDGDLG